MVVLWDKLFFGRHERSFLWNKWLKMGQSGEFCIEMMGIGAVCAVSGSGNSGF